MICQLPLLTFGHILTAMCPSYELWKWQLTSVSTATAALVGIGAWPKNDLTLVAAGFSAKDPAIASATGDVVGRFYAEDGTVIHYTDEPQLLAISTDQLQRVPHVIGIAVGIDKAKAVVGAARAGLISTLVTDMVTARAIAALLD